MQSYFLTSGNTAIWVMHMYSRHNDPILQAYYRLAEMNAAGQPVTLSAVNCVIQGCANIWDFDRAYQTFETIGTTFGLMPDVHSCNSLLDVFGKTRKVRSPQGGLKSIWVVSFNPLSFTFFL